MSSLLVILFGVVEQFSRFWIWSETECKTPAEYGLQGGGGGQREGRGATVHKYSSFIHACGNSSQAGSKIPAMSECISSL